MLVSPNGATYPSPGQRPGSKESVGVQALKGRATISPLQGSGGEGIGMQTQGVALGSVSTPRWGWKVAAGLPRHFVRPNGIRPGPAPLAPTRLVAASPRYALRSRNNRSNDCWYAS